ncbi:hypothetical protein B0H17DRAFT_1152606 [Mycena rosella]|uniref:Uncharacterized protein n=1 Tax=Mycena rosella TaxID=1033263 RepID=A0AAD7BCQ6_MYCRO|nr:hypothetical protein B0H17DRAFT_1152606 [Mycena rosella]
MYEWRVPAGSWASTIAHPEFADEPTGNVQTGVLSIWIKDPFSMPSLHVRQLRDWVQTPGRTDSERVARPIRLFAPFHGGRGAGLSSFFGVSWLSAQLAEWRYDGDYRRFALMVTVPYLFCVSLNRACLLVPHVAMPLYTESLQEVIYGYETSLPHVQSKEQCRDYAPRAENPLFFVNDDGLQFSTPTSVLTALLFTRSAILIGFVCLTIILNTSLVGRNLICGSGSGLLFWVNPNLNHAKQAQRSEGRKRCNRSVREFLRFIRVGSSIRVTGGKSSEHGFEASSSGAGSAKQCQVLRSAPAAVPGNGYLALNSIQSQGKRFPEISWKAAIPREGLRNMLNNARVDLGGCCNELADNAREPR